AQAHGPVFAEAEARAAGVSQYAIDFSSGELSVLNAGTIFASANAHSVGTAYHNNEAVAVAAGVRQVGDLMSHDSSLVTNTSGAGAHIVAVAHANATGYGNSRASALARAVGVSQYAEEVAGEADLRVLNSGTIFASAYANAVAQAGAEAIADAEGVFQFVDEAGHFDAQVTNYAGGVIHAGAFAQATDARARAHAAGVSQYAIDVASANLTTINDGIIRGSAFATAKGPSEATAIAFGVDQLFVEVFNPNATVHNSNLIVAKAQAFAPSGEAFAEAAGIR